MPNQFAEKEQKMHRIRHTMLASALALAFMSGMEMSHAHEIKLGNLTIVHPWAREVPTAADVATGFMKIENRGKEDDRLIKATAEISGNVQLHDMKIESGIMKMIELKDGIPIPAGKTVELKPKSLHVMFLNLKSKPMDNTEFKGILTFEKAGTVEVDYEVAAPDAEMGTH
jgi:copper(I)-binding protein